MDGDCFIKGNIAINSSGVAMRDSDRSFTVLYEELEVGPIIGRGASSYVQRATHRPTGTQLALKVINMFDKSKRDQLIKEVAVLYNADCPAFVSFYGAFYREGAITIALEFMDGGSLSNVLAQIGSIPEKVMANITFQILWGLAYLRHEKRIHRDIKPANLLINSMGQVKLTDFGVSSELQNSIAMCATFVGTYKYMSPERIASKPYSYASDVWSLGIVIMTCVTGKYPFPEADTYIEMVQTILDSGAPRLPRGRFSPELELLINECVQIDPTKRLTTGVLLGSPWLKKNGATSFDAAVMNVKRWIDSTCR